jgi:hypothetical protein
MHREYIAEIFEAMRIIFARLVALVVWRWQGDKKGVKDKEGKIMYMICTTA